MVNLLFFDGPVSDISFKITILYVRSWKKRSPSPCEKVARGKKSSNFVDGLLALCSIWYIQMGWRRCKLEYLYKKYPITESNNWKEREKKRDICSHTCLWTLTGMIMWDKARMLNSALSEPSWGISSFPLYVFYWQSFLGIKKKKNRQTICKTFLDL